MALIGQINKDHYKLTVNKTTSLFFSILYFALVIFGSSAFQFIIVGLNNIVLTDLAVRNIILFNLKICPSNLSPLMIGIWFYFNAEKLNQDKWTWVLIGLIGGQYSLVSVVLNRFFQRNENKQDLFKLFLNIILLLIIVSFIDYIPNAWLKPGPDILLHNTLMNKSLNAVSSFLIVKSVYMIGLNIFLALKINSMLREYNIKNKPVWMISTIITGLFTVILILNLLLIEKDKEIRNDSF